MFYPEKRWMLVFRQILTVESSDFRFVNPISGFMVEAAGIEPASVNPPLTGSYMFSLSTI